MDETDKLLRREFPQRKNLCYLNHAAVAPWPLRSSEAVQGFAKENAERGARDYPQWLAEEKRLRSQLRELLHADGEDEIALVKNTSEALSFVAWGLDWQPGDNVVITDQEFPSNRVVWESLRGLGVETRQAESFGAQDVEDAILALADARTRLIAVSSVQYASGLRLDLEKLGAACRKRGVLFCVDAIQSIGAVDFDVQAIQADFAMADGHKWMLGPEGLGVFYCRREHLDRLQLHEYGWHMVELQGDYDREEWQPARSARRFECGSANMLGVHALAASLSLLLELGMTEVEKRLHERVSALLERLQQIPGIAIRSPQDAQRRAGIVTFQPGDQAPARIHRALMMRDVVCAPRGGGIRFSPHFYTPETVLDRACEQLRAVLAEADS